MQGCSMHEIAEHWPAYTNDDHVGRVTISIWSPRLEKNIGHVWLPIEFSGQGTAFEVGTLDGHRGGVGVVGRVISVI